MDNDYRVTVKRINMPVMTMKMIKVIMMLMMIKTMMMVMIMAMMMATTDECSKPK